MGAMVSLTRPTPTRSSDPLTALCQRSQNAGALPLLTWYHGADRGELSARTLLTWVTKSVYLLDSEESSPVVSPVFQYAVRVPAIGQVACGCWPRGGLDYESI